MVRPRKGKQDKRSVFLEGFEFLAATEGELIAYIVEQSRLGRGGWLITANLDILRLAVTVPGCAAILRAADLLVADGMPLVWVSRLARDRLPERVSGATLLWSLSAAAEAARLPIYLVGGAPGAAQGTVRALRAAFPHLQVAGVSVPESVELADPAAVDDLVRHVAAKAPKLVFCALGFPKQEVLIASMRPSMPDVWFVGVGISFSYASGQVRRAPQWIQEAGFEWMWRAAAEPRRLIRRYLRDLVFLIPLAMRAVVYGGRQQ